VGMTASFALHEIEKLVPRMKSSVNQDPLDKVKIVNEVEELEDYVEGILSILKKGGNKPISLIETINQAVSNYSLRLKNWKIAIAIEHDSRIQIVKCDKRLLITMLMNLLDNSIYWLDTIYKQEKGIYIATRKRERGFSIIVVDNGPGFRDNTEDLIRPFFTRKEGGIGIGLYLIDTVMIQYGKLNFIYDQETLIEERIPQKYNGAAVELIFNKNI
jgi:signal transduction histidine kinase